MSIAVMLSVPIPSSEVVAQQSSKSASTGGQILSGCRSGVILSCKNFTQSSFVLQSHIPSHATMRNWSSPFLAYSVMSGLQVTACSSGVSVLLSLYWKSPMALLRAKFPSTLSSSTECPLFSIRSYSPAFWGLWSSLRAMAWLAEHRTALLSPELAQ